MDLGKPGQVLEMQTRLRQRMRLQPKQVAFGLLPMELITQRSPSALHLTEPLPLATALFSVVGMAWVCRWWTAKRKTV
ncbi:MAG TPA: hypothetical protein VKT29_07205 [Terriglobales bacterium]|nr:hypothetical protein [Terriglobales bacterium]